MHKLCGMSGGKRGYGGKQGGGLVDQREYCIPRKVAFEQGSEGNEGLSQAIMREAHFRQRE